MVDLGKSASKFANRQISRQTSRAKFKSKSIARTKARQMGQQVKKDAVGKVTAAKAERDAAKASEGSVITADSDEFDDVDGSHEFDDSGLSHDYPMSAIPVGFKPPRGLKLINDPNEIPEPFDWSKIPVKKILIVLAALIVAVALFFGVRWAAPKAVDLVRNTDVTVPAIPTTTVPPATTVPVVVITQWGEGACATSAEDGTARPSTCAEADYEVTNSIDYPDLELAIEEVRVLQELMLSLGVTVATDGILGPQSRGALNTFAAVAGLAPEANDRAKAATVRAASITDGAAPDGPRIIQSSPEVCGPGVVWVEDVTKIHCLGSL
jgi:hypothetical protein